MKGKLNVLIFLIVARGLAGCGPAKKIYKKPPTLPMFYDRVVLDYALRNPEMLSYAGIVENYGIHFHNDDLTDISDEFKESTLRQFKEDLQILRSYKKELDFQEQLSKEILEWYLSDKANKLQFIYQDYPIDHLDGLHLEITEFMTTIHQLNTKRDARNYIKRLQKIDNKFKQVIRGLKVRQKRDIMLPDFIIRRIIADLEGMLDQPAKENALYVNFEKKSLEISGLKEDKRDKMLNKISEILKESVYPSYQKLHDHLQSILPLADQKSGVWKLPEGVEFYTYMLRHHTTTDITPQEVYDLGVSEVKRIEEEIRTIFDELDFDPDIPIADHLRILINDPAFHYANNDTGRLNCLHDFKKIIDEVQKNSAAFLQGLDGEEILVKRIPRFMEKTASGGYYEAPSLDGSRPGVFYVNLRDMRLLPTFAMRTLAYHETVPGHHTQIVQQMNIADVPVFRTIIPFTAYVEGWALYSEKLAKEYGFITDPYDDLGRLQAELFRAARLVVDAGIHYKKWSRQEAVQYMFDNTGLSRKEIENEVDRYIVDPGQACAYKIGELKILELREKSRQALGDSFDIREFHRVVLKNGGMPLDVLEKVIDHYIGKKLVKSGKHVIESKEKVLD